MKYLFFYRYADGTEGFGFYGDRKEAKERMDEFGDQVKHYGSQVEYGIAGIEDTESLNLN